MAIISNSTGQVAYAEIPQGVHSTRGRRQWSLADALCAAAGVCLVFAICLRLGSGRTLWEDEVLGWVLLRDPSWRHMFWSWHHGVDGGGALFYVTARAWLNLFGDGYTAFRLYTATCFAAAFVLLWFTLRRFYSVPAAALAVLTGFFLSPALVQHFAEGRFYGLFFGATVAAAFFLLKSSETPRPTAWAHFVAFLLSSVLVTSHTLGVFYCGVLLLAWIAADALQGTRRLTLYLAVLAGWLWLIPTWPSIHAATQVGKPWFWTTQPGLGDFFLGFTGYSHRTFAICAALLLIFVLSVLTARSRAVLRAAVTQRAPILLVMAALFLAPILLFVEGFFAAPLFSSRYLQPVSIATVILVAELATQIDARWFEASRVRPLVLGAVLSAMLLMVLHYGLVYTPRHTDRRLEYAAALTSRLPAHVPVLCEDSFIFIELMREEASSNVHYEFLLDWANAISDAAPRVEVTQYHLMENVRNAGFFSDHIEYRDRFLAQHSYFLAMRADAQHVPTLLDAVRPLSRDTTIGNPLIRRFAADAQYRVLPFATISLQSMQASVALICRRDVDCTAVKQSLQSRLTHPQLAVVEGAHAASR